MFDDEPPPTTDPTSPTSPTTKKAKRSKSPKPKKKNGAKSPKPSSPKKTDNKSSPKKKPEEAPKEDAGFPSTDNKADESKTEEKQSQETWDRYDDLRLSDNEEETDNNNNATYSIPKIAKQGSVVDALMAGPYQPDNDKTSETKQDEAAIIKEDEETDSKPKEDAAVVIETTDLEKTKSDPSLQSPANGAVESKSDGETWDRYDDLKLSDEEVEEEKKDNKPAGPGLFVPLVPLKTQGSVVDMLMEGPYQREKEKPKFTGISVTPPEETKDEDGDSGGVKKDYSITVSHGSNTEIKVDGKNKQNDGKKEEIDKSKKSMVSLNADAFVYNENSDTFTVSLSGCKLLRSDFIKGKLTFEIKGGYINKDKSDKAEKQMDDQYITTVLDDILK